MLVLSRKKDEEIVIQTSDGEIRVMVVDIRGDKIRLGVEAPKHIPVHRLEVWEAIQQEQAESDQPHFHVGVAEAATDVDGVPRMSQSDNSEFVY